MNNDFHYARLYSHNPITAEESAQALTFPPNVPRFLSALISCRGNRKEQQDASACWCNTDDWLGIVADGAGGHLLGGLAAECIIATAETHWSATLGEARDDVTAWLLSCVTKANESVQRNTAGKGRSTIATLYIDNTEFHSIHLGDTRIYQIRNGEIIFRSKDHSMTQILYDRGEVTEEEFNDHPGQCRLYKALGVNLDIEPSIHSGTCLPGDIFLLCSDGFWTQTNNKEIIADLGSFSALPYWVGTDTHKVTAQLLGKTMEQITARAIDRANGQSDNVSALLVVCSPLI